MDKSLRNALIAGILLVGVSTFYYLVIYIPQRDQARLEQQTRQAEQLKVEKAQQDKQQKEDKFRAECIEEKKAATKQFYEAVSACANDECRKNAEENLLPDNTNYIADCLDRKLKGLPTFGY